MTEWLKTLSVPEIIALFFACIVGLLGLIAGTLWLLRKFGVAELSRNGFSFKGSRKKKSEKLPLDGKDIVILLTKQAEMLDQVHTLEKRVLKDQMIFVKSEALRLRGRAQSVFLRVLRDKLDSGEKNGLVDHPDYCEYVRALKDAIDNCKELIEASFEDNHYATRTEKDFQQYEQTKTIEIIQTITNFLNDGYRGHVVCREMIYDENQRIMDEFKTSVSKMFWNAREISVATAIQVKALRDNFDKLMKEAI
jgi:hypothetical protein